MDSFQLYKDMKARTDGEIYIGVVGPVRTGKSTFIKRFMDLLVLPHMEDENDRERTKDELPQSASGTTVMTTEPKFVPKEAAAIRLSEDVEVKIRLIDCVGFMVEGASGHIENDTERQVKTPWFEYEIPFTKAAAIGTQKVIHDHATIGLVVTTDGSICGLPRENYVSAEERTIQELQSIGKPFIILLNCTKPYTEEAKVLQASMEAKYNTAVVPVNCEQLKEDDVHDIMRQILYEFPISEVEFFIPKWVEMLPADNRMKQDIILQVKALMKDYDTIRDVLKKPVELDSEYIKRCKTDTISLSDGVIRVTLDVEEAYYYEMLTEMVGETITDEYQLISKLKDFAAMKHEYSKVLDAVNMVRIKGYGVVTPDKDEIMLEKPELIKHGNKFGVKIKASSPSIHMIRANIETEIAPIVGTQEQANDLIGFINQADIERGIWDTNIFGKTVEQLVNDGITAKVAVIGEESQLKLQDTMQKIVNDSNGGMVCIII